MWTKYIYFAQPIDFVNKELIEANFLQFQKLTQDLNVEIVAPYLESNSVDLNAINQTEAIDIVEQDYEQINKCDIFVADLSREDRQAIGIIFEMAHAVDNGKTIIIYTGNSLIRKRVWIIATTRFVCTSWEKVKEAVQEVLGS